MFLHFLEEACFVGTSLTVGTSLNFEVSIKENDENKLFIFGTDARIFKLIAHKCLLISHFV